MPAPEKVDPHEALDRPRSTAKPLYLRMYFETVYTEFVRFIGYEGKSPVEAQQFVLELEKKYGKEKVIEASEAVSTTEGKAENVTVRLTAEARRLAWQLLGPPAEHKPTDMIAEIMARDERLKADLRGTPVTKPRKKPRAQAKSATVSGDVIDQALHQPPRGGASQEQATNQRAQPIMEQYREAKERHPGMVLLFRVGDFYEFFEEDAKTAARVLGLTLTTRDRTISMAGFPHHSLENHLRTLLRAGHRVAICEQVDDRPPQKHEVSRVVVPGTLGAERPAATDSVVPRSEGELPNPPSQSASPPLPAHVARKSRRQKIAGKGRDATEG